MSKINTCLKRTFTIFNIFFAIVGGVIFALALLSQAVTNSHGGDELEGRTVGLIVLYVVGTVTMAIALLGAYGAYKESRTALIVFLVCMVIGSMMMLRAGVPAAIARPQMETVFEDRFRALLPLDKAPTQVRMMAESLQTQLHCCGLFSYEDWEKIIPDSCNCVEEEEMPRACKTINSFETLWRQKQTKSVYAKPCLPFMMHYLLLIVDIMIGVVFVLAFLALFGMALSSLMIHQLRYGNNNNVTVATTPVVFTSMYTGAPPKYQELMNTA